MATGKSCFCSGFALRVGCRLAKSSVNVPWELLALKRQHEWLERGQPIDPQFLVSIREFLQFRQIGFSLRLRSGTRFRFCRVNEIVSQHENVEPGGQESIDRFLRRANDR